MILRANPKTRALVTAASITLIVNACAGRPYIAPLVEGAPVSVEQGKPGEVELSAYSTVEGTGSGAAKGAGGGALHGAAAGVGGSWYMCGFYFLICMPFLAAGGAVLGGVVGTVGGAVHGGVTGLPQDKAEAFSKQAVANFGTMDFAARLREGVTERAARHWRIESTGERTRVLLRVDSMRFEQAAHDQLALRMTASLVTRREGARAGRESKRYVFSFDGVNHGVDQWLADGGLLQRREAEVALADLSDQMIEALRNPP